MIKIFSVPEARSTILARRFNHGDYSPEVLERTSEIFGEGVTPPSAVDLILRSIQRDGEKALREWSSALDGWDELDLLIPNPALTRAWDELPPALKTSLELAADRIRRFHELQPVRSWSTSELGGTIGQRVSPIERVGVYVPGGTAPLPSSLLMSVIPAQVAGVPEIVVATPPPAHAIILAAAHLCGIDKLYQVGGAQAIAGLAFGTKTITKVDKVVGAGNLFVTLAKQKLFGIVGIDGLAGPTETMIIADGAANPQSVAADLLAQAEHDVQARAILLTPDESLAFRVQEQVTHMLSNLSRGKIIQSALSNSCGIVVTESLDQAAELADAYAAEHLCLCVEAPSQLLEKINNAGGFFLGEKSCEVLGDYVAGPSHIMPTGGTARFTSPLNVLDFVKISSVIGLDDLTAFTLSTPAAEIAQAESLTAHAAAARLRAVEP